VSGLIFAAVAMGNELALRNRVASSSQFGPTDVDRDPPTCAGAMGIGPTARVNVHLDATVDGRSLGTVEISGDRAVDDVRWLAYVASSRELGLHGAATIGNQSWIRDPFGPWRVASAAEVGEDALDLTAFRAALSPAARAAAQTGGVGIIEGARSRQCRIAIDGPTFLAAFPQASWLVGGVDLAHWVGQLDYWVFLDGQIGLIQASVNGGAAAIETGALQGTVRVSLTATDRGTDIQVTPPA